MKRALLIALLAVSCAREQSTAPAAPPGDRAAAARPAVRDGRPLMRDVSLKLVPAADDAGSP